jgi:CRISPR/Cas system-associated protein Cas5 (RAMP superfamily)
MLHALLDSAQDYKDLEKDLTALSEKYLELLVKTACDVGETEKENVTLDIGSDKVKTTAVTLTLDTDAMAEIVLSLAEEASKDKQLRDTVKELVLLNSSALSGFNPYGYYYGYSMPDEDEINEQIDEFFENLLEEAEYVAEEIEDAGNVKLVLEFFVTKDGKTLAAFTMKGKEGSKTAFSMSLTLGKRLGSSEEISLKINDGWSDTVIRYTVSENTKTDYSARFTVQDGYSSMNVKISWNKSDGSYRVSSDEFELRGTLKQSGKKTTITVREISVDGYSMDIDLTVVLNENESVPSPGSYTDVLTVSERQIEDLVEDVSERLMESALFSLMRYL